MVLSQLSIAQQLDSESPSDTNFCVDDTALQQRKAQELKAKQKLLKKSRTSAVGKNSVLVDVSTQYDLPLPIDGILNIAVDSLKTKLYLKYDRVVLVGTGFDDEKLMKQAEDLEFSGFRDVKVFGGGRRELVKSQRVPMKMPVNSTMISAQSVISALTESIIQDEYLLINLTERGESNDQFAGLPMLSLLDRDDFSELSSELDKLKKNNRFAKLILLSESAESAYKLARSTFVQDSSFVWVLQGGVESLESGLSSLAILPGRGKNYRYSCIRR